MVRVQGLGPAVRIQGVRVRSLWSRVIILGVRVQGLGSTMVKDSGTIQCLGLITLELRLQGYGWGQDLEFRVKG